MASSSSEFNPEDEILVFYLMHKMSDDRTYYREGFRHVRDIDIYKCRPEELPPSLTHYSGKAKVYFTLSDRKHQRKVKGGGFWSKTGNVSEIRNGKLIARKSTLVYYEDNQTSEPVKTHWLMEEYILLDAHKNKEPKMSTTWTLCVVYNSRV